MSDSSDFVDEKPEKSLPQDSNFCFGSIPNGFIFASNRWKGSTILQKLRESFQVTTCDLSVADFRPNAKCVVIYMSENDYIGGAKTFKIKIAKLLSKRGKSPVQPIVICQRSPLSTKDFQNVQKLVVVDWGFPLIPVQDYDSLPQCLTQLCRTSNRPNPFQFGVQGANKSVSMSSKVVKMLTCAVVGLGEQNARTLLKKFGSLREISVQSEKDLMEQVGKYPGKNLYKFLNDSTQL